MRSRRGGRQGTRNGRGGGRGGDRCYNCNGFGHISRNCPKQGGSNAGGNLQTSRDPERRFFDKLSKDPFASIKNAQEATRLLKAGLTFAEVEGASALLYRLADVSLFGPQALKKSLEYMTDKEVFVNGLLPLLEFLGREELNKPVYSTPLNYILKQLYDLPFLVPTVSKHCTDGHVTSNNERTALIWFLAKICLENDSARSDDHIKQIANHLKGCGGATRLQTILDGSSALVTEIEQSISLTDVRLDQAETPGGRHDNDKQDFRSISIVPTLEEFLCDADPYLPKSSPDAPCNFTEAQLLDRQFRLLREDIIGPSKEQQDDPRKERRDIVYGLRVHHVGTGAAVSQNGKQVLRATKACICFKFQLPTWIYGKKVKGKREKEEYWDKNRRFLPKDALVCIQRRSSNNEWSPLRFATIARRESKELASEIPLIGLCFLTETDTFETLKDLSDRSAPPTRLFVISGELFAYQPILRGLQMMPAVPFAAEILRGEQIDLPEDLRVGLSCDLDPKMQNKVKMLDTAQNEALQRALGKRVALIQGPPGSGKTFIGVLIAQILLAMTSDIILIVTYTNHALDDLLEDLLDAGVTDIVRLGGRSKNDRLAEYNLREQASSDKAPFSREQKRRYAQLKQTIEENEKEVQRLQKILSREIGKEWWGKVCEFLEENDPEAWRQLHVNANDLKDEQGFQVQGISGVDHLWKCWLKGKGPPDFLRETVNGSLWGLSKEERRKQKIAWQHGIYEAERAAMATALATINTSKEELKQLSEISDMQVMSSARVIGCTTTKAAMSKSLLDGLSPGIVLVEEAAEILEAHVLTSLSPGTKRLIMIGDHKQLRPKCQHYPLTVEANRGLDLNRSLFERLASVMPISTLQVQHRMHPDISAIPRLVTYEDLKDAPGVINHPQPMGLPSRIVFIDHSVEEDHEADPLAIFDSVSRTNAHEVQMISGIVRYLFQQGYKPTDMVVLTPYLGQMTKIHKELARDFDVFVDDRDLAEARERLGREEITLVKKSEEGKESLVRVATIDNYQGEEAKIVLVSLVRSNFQGDIGFLREPERVNVMLSRARECEIIIGSRETFEKARGSLNPLRGGPLWKKIFESLKASGFIYDGLPVQCQHHKKISIVESPLDFQNLCPDGGCTQKCHKMLECGHPCQKRCHVGSCMQCQVDCLDTCPRGHFLMRKCSQDPPQCKRDIVWRCPLSHRVSAKCWQGSYHTQCKSCLKLSEESSARKAEEIELQRLLESKSDQLVKLKSQLEDAQQAKRDREDMERIEKELFLARKALDEEQESTKELASPTQHEVDDARSELNTKVRKILQSSHPRALNPNDLLRQYKDHYESDLRDDAQKISALDKVHEKSRKRRKLKDMLTEIPCCEVFSETSPSDENKSKMLVRLRDESPGANRCEALSPTQKKMRKENEVGGEPLQDPPGQPKDAHNVPEIDVLYDAVVKESKICAYSDIEALVDGDDVILQIMQRYQSNGALEADNFLDQEFHPAEKAPDGILALRSIIQSELDPIGIIDSSPPTAKTSQSGTTQALCYLSNAVCFSDEFPLQAKRHAENAMKIVHEFGIQLPAEWIQRAKSLVESSSIGGGPRLSDHHLAETSGDEWKKIEANDWKAPSIMRESILPMIGLEEVKRCFINMYHSVKLSQEQGEGSASSYNVRFEGNPGTGKTTIARHYGAFLRQLDVLDKNSIFRETNGAKLSFEGVKGLKDMLKDVGKCGGGVVFVDEAYQLSSDREGKRVLDFILPLAESLKTEYGKLVWIFAGYKKPMEKLFEYNDGLPSRFPLRYVFEDYADAELQRIFGDMMIYQSSASSGKCERQKSASRRSTSTYNAYTTKSEGSTVEGSAGGTWTYRSNIGWTDRYGNVTVDPSQVGSRTSELVTKAGEFWTETSGVWTNRNGVSQSHYPGSPAPMKSARTKREEAFHCTDDRHLRIAIRRLGRCRGENGFGNARAVRDLFDKVRDRQASRIAEERKRGKSPDIFEFAETDLLGPKVTASSLKTSTAWKELEAMEGLVPVKESVEQIFKLALKNVERERREEKLYEIALNRLFLGNPGTGKTTVAKLYGEILADLGLLSKGEVVMKCASDFLGEALGQSEKQTNSILDAARGNVLVIDEAYSLYSGGSGKIGSNDPYKTAVIDTIVEKVQSKPGADIAVIMLGYKEQMEEMMKNVNPGLSRRFQIENAFVFPDFDDASLCRIMMASARQREVTLKIGVAKRAVQMLAKARSKPHFGNAGSVDNLLSKAMVTMQGRDDSSELIPADFGYSGDGPDSKELDCLFDDMIGCAGIKVTMDQLRATVEFSVSQGKAANTGVSFNYLFLGNPGTGKTTVARKMGVMFHSLGLLPSDELHESKASDLITGYSGQSGIKTRDVLKSARGGTLFIDEAYQLNPERGGHYMTEVVDELVGALTHEEFKGKVLVILAGYDEDMENMLQKTNPGMRSRFSERVHFENFDAEATTELLKAELRKLNIPLKLESEESSSLHSLSERLVRSKDFGNGRDIVSWADHTYKAVARSYRDTKARRSIGSACSIEHVEEALDHLLKTREVRTGGQKCASTSRTDCEAVEAQEKQEVPPTPTVATKAIVEQQVQEEMASDKPRVVEELPGNLFEGIDKSVLRSLQNFIEEQKLDSEAGVRHLVQLDPTSQEFANLVTRLLEDLNMSHSDATAQLLAWQSQHKDLDEMLQEQAHKEETLGVRPIWRCGVCGRADKPWIACSVAPFIVRYEKVPLN